MLNDILLVYFSVCGCFYSHMLKQDIWPIMVILCFVLGWAVAPFHLVMWFYSLVRKALVGSEFKPDIERLHITLKDLK